MATEGKSDDGSEFNAYTMNMDYNLMSSPLNYELAIMNPTGTKLTNFDYLYGTDIQPNAPIKVGDMTYTYDASGNPITIDGEEVGRSMTYDSDNRLREIMDYRKNIMSRYTYNHAGERAVKRYGAFESMAVNGAPAGSKLDANAKYSAYVSPYYVENGSGTKSGAFSKNYYAGSDRIASKTADDAYFYFTDHLGSTTHITDRSGDVAQYAAYTPYGSLFREYRSVQPYKFNGKELDQETGYYYYGARYYDPTTALWLGTDPLKHKYPDIGAYVYCAGNPVKYVDPDGRKPWDNNHVKKARKYAESNSGSVIIFNNRAGYESASVTIANVTTNKEGNYEIEVQGYYYEGNANNNHNAVWNFMESIDIPEGHSDPANLGTTTTKDFRAMADLCENVSYVADGAAAGAACTVILLPYAGGAKLIGTVAGGTSDVINIGVDLYEEKTDNMIIRSIGAAVNYMLPKAIKFKSEKYEIIKNVVIDKVTNIGVNQLTE